MNFKSIITSVVHFAEHIAMDVVVKHGKEFATEFCNMGVKLIHDVENLKNPSGQDFKGSEKFSMVMHTLGDFAAKEGKEVAIDEAQTLVQTLFTATLGRVQKDKQPLELAAVLPPLPPLNNSLTQELTEPLLTGGFGAAGKGGVIVTDDSKSTGIETEKKRSGIEFGIPLKTPEDTKI